MSTEILHVLLCDATILLVSLAPCTNSIAEALKLLAVIGAIILLKAKYPQFSEAQKHFQKIAIIVLACIAVISIIVGFLSGTIQ